jgi:hypothetical protein
MAGCGAEGWPSSHAVRFTHATFVAPNSCKNDSAPPYSRPKLGFYPTREITDLRTYLTDVAGLCPSDDQPRAGDVVELRRSPDGKVMEAWLPCGRRLGRLPPADCLAVGELLAERASSMPAEITAIVPRPGGVADRIHVELLSLAA